MIQGTPIFCRTCWACYVVAGELPTECPACHGAARWTTIPKSIAPSVEYTLTYMDRALLRSLHIKVDDEAVKA